MYSKPVVLNFQYSINSFSRKKKTFPREFWEYVHTPEFEKYLFLWVVTLCHFDLKHKTTGPGTEHLLSMYITIKMETEH